MPLGCGSLQRGRAPSSAEIRLEPRVTSGIESASTGPRSFERGNSFRTPLHFLHEQSGFNGAALLRARKWHVTAIATHPSRRFNGAALLRARKCSPTPPRSERMRRASTGPRSFERGNTDAHGTPLSRVVKLQRGRAPSSAEMQYGKRILNDNVIASTGPRSFERGNAPNRIPSALTKPSASTGPRSFERGDGRGL